MQKNRILLIVILACLLSSCITPTLSEPTASFFPTTSQQATISPTITSTLLPTVTNTATLQPTFTSTFTLTATPTSLHLTDIQYQDIEIESSIPPEINGVLVLRDLNNDNENFLLDLHTGKEMALHGSTKGIRLPSISPDGKLLAYFDWGSDQLQIASSDGQLVFSYPAQENWWSILGWLDNERLTISTLPYLNDGIQIILNAFTGEWQELLPSFPYDSSDGTIVSFDRPEFAEEDAVYDPTLSYAIIERYLRDESRSAFELWDTQSEGILWQKSDVFVQARPIWSPDGEYFSAVYMLASEQPDYPNMDDDTISLYVIDKIGKESKITNFVNGGATWSQDGRYLAILWHGSMQFVDWYDGAYAFSIIDLVTREITVFSIVSSSSYHVWSPDGQYVALDNVLSYGDEPEETKKQVVVVDLVENRAFAVVQDSEVVGWMVSPQK